MKAGGPVVGVLDDEDQMRKALSRLLATYGYRVEAYACSADLLAVLSFSHLGCLILDLHMPDLNGFEVLQTFIDRCVTLPVIVITGHDMPGTEERVRSLGAAAYLLKPVDDAALVAAIRHVT
jgi:two-component system response regulator FixJ